MRNFFPTEGGARSALRTPNEQDAAVDLVNQQANRRLTDIRRAGARAFQPMAGQEASPDDLRRSATYQLLKKKLMAVPATAGLNSPERLAAQADLQEFEEKEALRGASQDIERDWRSEIGTTLMLNPYTGKRSDGDAQHLTKRAASAMANNTALGKASPVAGAREEDPRLTTQFRNAMGRMAKAQRR